MLLAHRDFVMAVLTGRDEVTTRRMFGCDAFLTRTQMLAFLTDTTLVVRIPEPERARLLKTKKAKPFYVAPKKAFGRWTELPLRTSAEVKLALRMAQRAHAETAGCAPAPPCPPLFSPTIPPRTRCVTRRL